MENTCVLVRGLLSGDRQAYVVVLKWIGIGIGVLIALSIALSLAGFGGGAKGVEVTSMQYAGWPFTQGSGKLFCTNHKVVLRVDGVSYALNGAATSGSNVVPVDEIMPKRPGSMMFDPLAQRAVDQLRATGLTLCE